MMYLKTAQLTLRIAALVIGSCAFLIEIGFYIENDQKLLNILAWTQSLTVMILSIDLIWHWLGSWHKADYFRRHFISLIVILATSGLCLAWLGGILESGPWLKFLRYGILIVLISSTFIRLNQKLIAQTPSPALTLMISFLTIIFLGTLLLMLPACVPQGQSSLSFLTALFMSTSATCVTGLSLVPLNSLTVFGQVIILILIQIGGLGLLTFVAVFSLAHHRGLGLKERIALRDALNYESLGEISRLIKNVILITLSLEALGCGALYFFWEGPHWQNGQPLEGLDRLYCVLFHAISAFCNAGFSLYENSLESFYDNTPVLLILSCLVITGGLGFLVLINLRSQWFSRTQEFGFWARSLSLQTRLMLWGSLILLISGFLIFFALEIQNPQVKNLSVTEKLTNCFFQSVTLRTAGFNTFDFSGFQNVTLLFCISFMLIGGGPGGTAGGMKVSTLALMVLSVGAAARGQDHIQLFNRRLPSATLNRALVVVTTFAIGFFVINGLLFLTDGTQFDPIALLFESASAYATVGLSTGITTEISTLGKYVLIFGMIAGRLGPLTVVLAMGQKKVSRVRYPQENVMIG